MCPDCKNEYADPNNRRFHAEPIACPVCGPEVRLVDKNGKEVPGEPLLNAARLLLKGKILAIKGLGGFHLACDATDNQAVARLRQKKARSRKPLALMVEAVNAVRQFCQLPRGAVKTLRSPAAPIVLLPKKIPPLIPVSPLIAPDNGSLGVMCAYTPLHLILFQKLRELCPQTPVLVMTSANFSEEPIAIDETELFSRCRPLFDYALIHNRKIANRCDDSVVQIDSGNPLMVRRSRGYVPQPLKIGPMFHVKHPTLAMGADGKTCFALGSGEAVIPGPHIGDLDSAESEIFFRSALKRLTEWSKIKPGRVVCDLHPDYSSVRLAEKLAKSYRAKLARVQHHYAHILSVMAEYQLPGPVIGLAADGTGYGIDGAIWGCEIILVNKDLSWRRVGNLKYLHHRAGAGVVADPVQVAASYLSQCGIQPSEQRKLGIKPVLEIANLPIRTSSLGRLFDAAAAITRVCSQATFDGEPAIALEAAALTANKPAGLKIKEPILQFSDQDRLEIDPKPLLTALFDGAIKNLPGPELALWFHLQVANQLSRALIQIARRYRISTVCLSGGSMQNGILRKKISSLLTGSGLKVFYNRMVPLNDGGIALGQAVVPDNF